MAKGIVKKTEKAAKKQLRQEGAFKGLSRKERIALAKKTASESRDWIRSQMAEGKKAQAVKKSASDAKKRKAAMASGQRLAYEGKSKPIYSMADVAPGGVPTRKIKSGDKVSKEKGMYKIVGADGYVRYSQSEPEIIKRRKNKAMYGAKVKLVKKAPGGAAMKKMPTYKKGGVLKSVPSDNKGLPKLATSVRNNMGYMEDGGKIGSKIKSIQSKIDSIKKKKEDLISTASNYQKKTGKVFGDFGQADEIRGMESQIAKLESQLKELKGSGSGSIKKMEDGGRLKRLKKKAHKKLTKGYNLTEKVEDSKRGKNLLTGKAVKPMSEKKMDRLRKRADKKNRKGFAALKKMKDGGKVVKRGMEQRPVKPFRTMKEIEDRRNEEKKAKRLIKK